MLSLVTAPQRGRITRVIVQAIDPAEHHSGHVLLDLENINRYGTDHAGNAVIGRFTPDEARRVAAMLCIAADQADTGT